jgi:hypothetical protein
MVRVGNRMWNQLADDNIAPIQTAIVSLSDLAATDRAYAIASILSRTRCSEVYLVLVTNIEPRRELSDPEELKGAMRLIEGLESSGLKVIVGFCSTDILLWKYAGATYCASGKFFNLRRFTSSRFEEPSGGGGQLPYWIEEAVIAYLRESDLIRVRNANLISTASQTNPYGNQIVDTLTNQPGTAWLKFAWRQYLYWFADIEDRINNQQVNVAQMLLQAEQNWTNLEDHNVLMEERRNDGQWIRAWRRAIAEI